MKTKTVEIDKISAVTRNLNIQHSEQLTDKITG